MSQTPTKAYSQWDHKRETDKSDGVFGWMNEGRKSLTAKVGRSLFRNTSIVLNYGVYSSLVPSFRRMPIRFKDDSSKMGRIRSRMQAVVFLRSEMYSNNSIGPTHQHSSTRVRLLRPHDTRAPLCGLALALHIADPSSVRPEPVGRHVRFRSIPTGNPQRFDSGSGRWIS